MANKKRKVIGAGGYSIGQRVIVHLQPPFHVEAMDVPGVITGLLRARKDRPHLPLRYKVMTAIVPCGGGACDPSAPGADYWNVPQEMLSESAGEVNTKCER